MRAFETGATRDTDETKPDYAGYLSPLVLKAYGAYMKRHELQADGKRRKSSNWKNGMPKEVYLASLWRHFLDVHLHQEGLGEEAREPIEEALCAVLFNAMGLLYEVLKEQKEVAHAHND